MTTTTTTTTPIAILVSDAIQSQTLHLNSDENVVETASVRGGSFSFGCVAPGGSSQPLVIQLFVEDATAINNIKLALINTGGIVFGSTVFGIKQSETINPDVVVDQYFTGVNTDDSSINPYNISISNADKTKSRYVYLKLNLPNSNFIGVGNMRLKWFFDYA